jgi:DNA repair protein RecN (Recombination protein N)
MLHELRVENLLLIERAELRLAPGLNVLTGETGAGKTVLAHALDLLLGGRAKPGIVRPGAQEAYVEGAFEASPRLREELGERLPAGAEEIVLARRVGAEGRTRAYLNGRSLNVGELREIASRVLAFYGQHEHRKLTLAAAQLQVLDELCGRGHAALLAQCAASVRRVRGGERRLADLRELAGARERELDLLDHELSEIDAADLREGEPERLLAARERLRSLAQLRGAAGAGAEALSSDCEAPGAAELIAQALSRIEAAAGLDARLDALEGRLRTSLIETGELARELRDYCERAADIEDLDAAGQSGDAALDTLEERLAAIERLLRKHGGSVESLRLFAQQARARRAELAGVDDALAVCERELSHARAELRGHASLLRSGRAKAARRLAREVRAQLAALAMREASFEVVFSEREPTESGADAVEFVIAPNPGVPAAPLREIASGGELSRIMLAILSVASDPAGEATLVFDEVDAGVGGHTARAVGARLRELAGRRQVLCITHLPQIASLAQRHFAIEKDVSREPALATVEHLAEPQVVAELVRMLGADGDDVGARRHARELRRAA